MVNLPLTNGVALGVLFNLSEKGIPAFWNEDATPYLIKLSKI